MGRLYGQVVLLGISPQYFLDEMSFDEINALLSASSEREKREFERERMQWFYTVVAQSGTGKIKEPRDLIRFEWEKPAKKKGRKLSKEELKSNEEKAKQWLARVR